MAPQAPKLIDLIAALRNLVQSGNPDKIPGGYFNQSWTKANHLLKDIEYAGLYMPRNIEAVELLEELALAAAPLIDENTGERLTAAYVEAREYLEKNGWAQNARVTGLAELALAPATNGESLGIPVIEILAALEELSLASAGFCSPVNTPVLDRAFNKARSILSRAREDDYYAEAFQNTSIEALNSKEPYPYSPAPVEPAVAPAPAPAPQALTYYPGAALPVEDVLFIRLDTVKEVFSDHDDCALSDFNLDLLRVYAQRDVAAYKAQKAEAKAAKYLAEINRLNDELEGRRLINAL